METKKILAIDLGAESGRGVLGEFTGDKITVKELYRFSSQNVKIHSHIYWDVLSIFSEIKKIISLAGREGNIEGIGITTWGVDYGLFGDNGLLLSNPFHYRDSRTKGVPEEVGALVGSERLYEKTGIQSIPIASLFQLYATKKEFPYLFDDARKLLFMPDIFNFFLTGEQVSEYTIATTSAMYNSNSHGQMRAPRGNWNYDILEELGLPGNILADVISPGTFIANVTADVKEETGCGDIPVYAVCCHDTASAVAGVPAGENLWAYISSGTWSLLGVEIENPIINEKSFRYNFSNEGGFGGTIRFLKNIMGLWIWQECRKEWVKEGKEYSYLEMTEMADKAKSFSAFIDINRSEFLFPGNMVEKIQSFCSKTGQEVPQGIDSITRVILESLAMEYKYAFENLEDSLQNKIETLHIVGGGSQNRLLSQFSASATKKTVMAGPVEATSAGNLLVQAMAKKDISDISQLRTVVRNSFPLFVYQPKETALWDQHYETYKKLKDVRQGF
ncbi:MAG TPA: rhamnulokinase family protein [bacterium]|nr:rhamnulokinase family protein [bacterium]